MSKHCPPENKYPPKPCPCPEIPGPPGPQGPQGVMGTAGSTFSARIDPPPTTGATMSLPGNAFTAVPINGVGPFTYNWNTNVATTSPQASTYIVNTLVSAAQSLTVTVGGPNNSQAIVTSQSAIAEGVIVCEITDTGIVPNPVALAYHYINISTN